jgi:hypothetical protein
MSNAAAKVLKEALKKAEQARDRIRGETAADIEKGRIAGLRLEEAEDAVHELTVALDMLDRPLMERVPQQTYVEQYGTPELPDGLTTERPPEEDMNVGGVRITRRRAE